MKPLLILVTALFAAPILTVATPAYCQTDQAASLLEALSLVSGRMLTAPLVTPEVTHDGDQYRVHIPLPKLSSPPGAAIDVLATPLASGAWDITRLTFPQTGTIVTPGTANAPPVSMHFSIGQQAAHAQIDPTLTVPSPYAMLLSDLALHIEGATPANLTLGRITFEGTITGDAEHRMTARSRSRAENWQLTSESKAGALFSLSLKTLDIRYDLDGLDRAKAEHLRETVRAMTAERQAAPKGQPPAISLADREQVRGLIDATAGLLSGFDIEERFHGLHVETGTGIGGDVAEIRFDAAATSTDNRLTGQYDIGAEGLAFPSVPAAYAPRRFAIKTVFAGIPVEALRHLLRQATEVGADPDAIKTKAIGLLNEPGARAGIESMVVEAGPLVVQGSGRVRPLPDGSAGFDVHLTARGLDAMMALMQSDPAAQQVMPMIFMAKGMGKAEGDGLVWDIAFADGIVTVNGVPMGGPKHGGPPMGQRPGAGVPGARPPANR